MNKLQKLVLGSAITSIASISSIAHGDANDVVQARMDAMSAISSANRALTNISRGRSDFDLATVTSAAKTIAENSEPALLDLFVEGTEGGESGAKAEIWQNWDQFSGLANDLNLAATGLSQITSEEEFADAYKKVSSTCGSCHKNFRASR